MAGCFWHVYWGVPSESGKVAIVRSSRKSEKSKSGQSPVTNFRDSAPVATASNKGSCDRLSPSIPETLCVDFSRSKAHELKAAFSEQTIGAEAERNFRRTIWEEKPAQAIAPNLRSVGEPNPVSNDGHSVVHEEDNRPLKGVFICTYRLIRPVARRIASGKGEPPARFGVNHHSGIVFGRQTVWSGQRKRLQGTPSDEEQRRYHSGRSVEGDRGGVPREQHVRRSKSSPVTHGGPNQHSSRIRCAMCSCVVRPRNALKMVRCSRSGSHL
ncbi:uncharacterized protein LOC110679230 [Aedes aegypti]|uniref:Uncharacterized protein n=1 Tax=Aedes aegypti TaxID=7159 RepID=A0A6I8U3D2_AEDAE|nr:uncharacterized protein LOC110679230 [Aedes aegypti]